MSNYCFRCHHFHDGLCFPIPAGLQEGPNGKLLPVYRVRAWRVANEDYAPWSVVMRRAPPVLEPPGVIAR